MNTLICCFSGHRRLPNDKLQIITENLNNEIEKLINEGVDTFYCGGGLGFDRIAASIIAKKKDSGINIRLIFALPCKKWNKLWNEAQKKPYVNLLGKADEVIYVSENYYDGCMEKRNQYMVDVSDFCICALLYERTGTSQTVRMAKEKGIKIINTI